METLLFDSIIENYVETPRHRDEELLTTLERMSAAFCSTRNVVEIEYSPYFERYVPISLYESQIATWIADFWEVNDSAIREIHSSIGEKRPPSMMSPPKRSAIGLERTELQGVGSSTRCGVPSNLLL